MRRETPVHFDALLELLHWGRNVYTVIKVPDELADRARAELTRRVEGHLDDIAVNVGLNRTDVIPETFIYVGGGLQRRLGLRPGDVARCRLVPADPDHVPLPEDVLDALEQAGRRDAFEHMPATDRRRLLAPIEGAARPETKQRRIAAMITSLALD
jgi:hypothetical protein